MSSNIVDQLQFGVATASLGFSPKFTLEHKFAAIHKAGFKYCEVGFGGYVEWVRQKITDLPVSTCPEEYGEGGEPDPSDEKLWEALYSKTEDLKALAASHGLTILVLQPLNQFEGWTPGSERHQWCRRKAEKWLPLCSKLGVQHLQVGSNDKPEATATFEEIGRDLNWLAELGAKQNPPVKIAYESWCFGERLASWEDTWKLVQLGDHPNLGLCLDTAHWPLSPIYGYDPTTGEGFTDQQFDEMLDRISKIPGEKIFYVELSDVLQPVIPLGQGSPFDEWRIKANSPRGDRFVWAVCGRPVPFVGRDAGRQVESQDDMGAAKVMRCFNTLLASGFKGPVMWECFEALTMEREDEDISALYADAMAVSKRKLIEGIAI
ncbi:uncharacterized protein I303_108145 [Kwoniella dejecticola CBS 10117]|uniref:3-dehydroshikimate dehydratase n=1 Tax=Kwoniella dejecticola CBS 10117 TaxID=1296121 RepID=A0A1A5ZY70_9TREE|nr:3-dehydroshikimate dehydratase [Kwoniella dejecticola CBS 10117]OBR82762.1 3-dehydroshikimate dehydratase [Kwoniella dejecticola CBS 10117]